MPSPHFNQLTSVLVASSPPRLRTIALAIASACIASTPASLRGSDSFLSSIHATYDYIIKRVARFEITGNLCYVYTHNEQLLLADQPRYIKHCRA